ncbi:hypothetical protein Pfo_004639 [Paulownia fortunei]|nr:hypothetical protein Pfo_004639 [Paulownia fortunei]
MLLLLIATCKLSGINLLFNCYDPLDPNGNITVTFDILMYTLDGYARVTIQNYYQYRHVEKPGNCSSFKYQVPHSCKPDPVIVDLMADAMPQNRSDGCCHGGVLAAWAIDPSMSYSSFEVTVGNLEQNSPGYAPLNLTLMAPGPGYTCGPVMDTSPTVSSVIGEEEKSKFRSSGTWKSTCTYSSYLANKIPVCCVSLSTFYNPIVTLCPSCSCGCRPADQPETSCIREGVFPPNLVDADIVQCTDHMCSLRIHWRIKNNYLSHWRVKLTVSNYHYGRKYSDWNVLVQHPGFGQPASAYGFNSTTLPTVGVPEEVALFLGKAFYNTELLQADEHQTGSETTEILMQKDSNSFTLGNGWAFPRRIYFNGENCQMPLPDTFPMLPNSSPRRKPSHSQFLLLAAVYLTCRMLVRF